MKLPAILKNKYVTIAAAVFAILNVVGYAMTRSWECLVIFAATAYSVKCYTNNLVLGLLGGLFVANFVFGCGRVKENFQEGETDRENGVNMGDVKKAAEKAKKDLEEEGADEETAADGAQAAAAVATTEKMENLLKQGMQIVQKMGLNKEGLECREGEQPNEAGDACIPKEGLQALLSDTEGMKGSLSEMLDAIKDSVGSFKKE